MKIDPHWKLILRDYLAKESCKNLIDFINNEYQTNTVYPPENELFSAFSMTSFNQVSVVIIGQDPYHGPGQAHGLAFSVPNNITLLPSLLNIYKEIESDLGIEKDFTNGNLTSWANQGVLLLNSVLTVRTDTPGSHVGHGWEEFTDHVIKKISDQREHVVFMLWGNYAKNKGSVIDRSRHLVLETSHPSPLGAYRGFNGCKHFSQTNNYLQQHNKTPIKW